MNELRKMFGPKPVDSMNKYKMKGKTTVVLGTPNLFLQLSCKKYKTHVYSW